MMTISSRTLAILAGAGSGWLLLSALFYQWLGYIPCELCILQRWPHLAAVIIAALIAFRDVHLLRWLGVPWKSAAQKKTEAEAVQPGLTPQQVS